MAVAYMEASSPKDAAVVRAPMIATAFSQFITWSERGRFNQHRKPYANETGPPLTSPDTMVLPSS